MSATTPAGAPTTPAASYAVPALDKALDILELLAARSDGLTQAQIAEEVGRSVGEIFRVLQALERRGFILRDRPSGLYLLSTRMFELAQLHPPLRGFVQRALGPMQRLASDVVQSCNLSVLDGAVVRVVAQAESPGDFGFRVRVGAAFEIAATTSGAVLLAFAPDDIREYTLAELRTRGLDDAGADALETRMRVAERQGFLEEADAQQAGILDLVYPVLGRDGHAIGALTVPCVTTSYSEHDAQTVSRLLAETAVALSALMRGDLSDV
ncbi:IclR family transcriptional regulator [Leifsonia sp. YAF41]|uniref:IclR family transcriptional regulator n=1 Tax=Leifsonia sp. YAF41 TaxID=3233086 RepID=UPI003F9CCC4E